MSQQPCFTTITQAVTKIAQGRLSCAALVSSCLEQIQSRESSINAWAYLDRAGALETAQQYDIELRQGKRRGVLHGIPFGIKDIFYVAGMPLRAGSPLLAGFVPDYDATVIARLKSAGAIILGKTHTTQFAFLDPAPTRNPWNTARTPGGSSSGSAAGTAAGMCLAALGSQTMGSTLRPAAYCGIVGLKAGTGILSNYGAVPVSWTLDHVGILARSVQDAAIILQCVGGYDPCDVRSLDKPLPACLESTDRLKPPAVGLLQDYFFERADEEMRRETLAAVEKLQRAGAAVEEVALPPEFAQLHPLGMTIMAVEAAAYHEATFDKDRDQFAPNIRKLIEDGLATGPTKYARALQSRLEITATITPLLGKYDILVTPCTPGPTPDAATTGSAVMQAPWSVLGVPTIGLPTGLSRDRLPLAIQLITRHEAGLLAAARWCERALDAHLELPAKND